MVLLLLRSGDRRFRRLAVFNAAFIAQLAALVGHFGVAQGFTQFFFGGARGFLDTGFDSHVAFSSKINAAVISAVTMTIGFRP